MRSFFSHPSAPLCVALALLVLFHWGHTLPIVSFPVVCLLMGAASLVRSVAVTATLFSAWFLSAMSGFQGFLADRRDASYD